MKASLKGRYEMERSSATAIFTVPAGNALIKASMTDATFAKGSSLNGLALSLVKPGSFIIDYNVPNQDFRFQFMNTVQLLEKPVGLTYTHVLGAHQTAVDGSVALDPANKLSVNYSFGSGNCKVKYVYAHGELRRTVLEPIYDVSKNTWDFAVTRKFEAGDSLKATYQTSSKVLGLEWNRDSKINGCFKSCSPISPLRPLAPLPKPASGSRSQVQKRRKILCFNNFIQTNRGNFSVLGKNSFSLLHTIKEGPIQGKIPYFGNCRSSHPLANHWSFHPL